MRRGVVWVWVVLASVLLVPGAWAQRPPDQVPMDYSETIIMNFDRSLLPGGIRLLAERTLLAYDGDPAQGFGQLHFTCNSSQNPATGQCPTADTGENGSYVSRIQLQFTELRSGMVTSLAVEGYLERADSGLVCHNYWQFDRRPIWTSYSTPCPRTPASGTAASLFISDAELSRLVAGRWVGRLELTLRSSAASRVASFDFNFQITITDYDAVSIYFPEFPQTTPNVDLNLSYDPLAQTVGGRKPLDMCLYDGLGSQSEYLGLTVTDTSGRPPGPLGYSLWHDDGGSSDDQRLDYMIELEHAGVRRRMANGVEEQLRGIDTAKLRLVLLPGMTQPVFCVPTPLLLTTPRVPITEQRAGGYEGQLKVELRLPTTRP